MHWEQVVTRVLYRYKMDRRTGNWEGNKRHTSSRMRTDTEASNAIPAMGLGTLKAYLPYEEGVTQIPAMKFLSSVHSDEADLSGR
jgi:hypothetical protein